MTTPAVYACGANVYLNLTMECPTACLFCAKTSSRRRYKGLDLTLPHSPGVAETWHGVIALAARRSIEEFVFCGFGESTHRLGVLVELAERMKRAYARPRRRLNTIGLGSAIWRRDIVPDLAPVLDAVSVSLNTADPAQWLKLHRPRPEFREGGYQAVLDFIRRCVAAGLDTTVTAVELPGVDAEAVRRLSASLGASFRSRPPLKAAELLEAS